MTEDVTATLAEAVLADSPPGAVIVDVSVAPDGRRAAALTVLPSASYLMDDLYEWSEKAWRNTGGGSGGPGINWTGSDLGVLRFSGEAPADARSALIGYAEAEHRVSIAYGYFLFVAWDTPFSPNPTLIRFD